jgi:hypothetical protein
MYSFGYARSVSSHDDIVPIGVDINLVQISLDMGQCKQSLVHDAIPKPGKVCEEIIAKISARQRWQILDMA